MEASPTQIDPASIRWDDAPDPASIQWDDAPAAPQGRMGSAQYGTAEALASMGSAALAATISGFAGLASMPFTDNPAGVIERVQGALTYQPRSMVGKQALGAISKPFELLADVAYKAGGNVAEATGSPALGAGVNTAIQFAPALLSPLLRGIVRRGNSGASGPRDPVAAGKAEAPDGPAPQAGRQAGLDRVPEKPPTIEELRAQKNAAYDRAKNTGVAVSRNAMTKLKVRLVNEMKNEGMDKDLHPKAYAAVRRVLTAKGQQSLNELETLRKIGNDAKGSIDPADARLGSRLVEIIDEFEDGLGQSDVVSGNAAAASAYQEARALNTRLSKAKEIGELFRRAENKAGANFTQSGLENALRQEFKALANNENRFRRFNAQERAAIEKVARGGKMENTLRQLGKLAPTGVISAGMGQIIGFLAGGPVGMAVIPAGGFAARAGATRMTLKNANRAEELMRRGPDTRPKRRNALAEAP